MQIFVWQSEDWVNEKSTLRRYVDFYIGVWWRLFSAETYDSANSNFVRANIFALTQYTVT